HDVLVPAPRPGVGSGRGVGKKSTQHPRARRRRGVSRPVAAPEAHSPVVTVEPPRHFDAFYESEYPRLLRVLSAADISADDALQEAFTKAAIDWPRISQYEDPAGWVRHVAVRRILDERRSTRRKRAAMERLAA